MTVLVASVAQIVNLLYRRLATCECDSFFTRSERVDALPIANRRHGRLPACATQE